MFHSHLHFIGGEKGGVGKSVVARVLAQYFIDKEWPFRGFDTDKSNGALMRFYSDYASPVIVSKYEDLDKVMEAAVESGQRVLVDLAAQTHSFLSQWINDSGIEDLAREMNVGLTYWHVMDAGRDSVDLLRKLLDQFGQRLQLIVVLNEVRGGEFDILKASGELDRAQALGAHVVSLRKLSDATMQKIDQFSTSFWAASQMENNGGTGLGLFERQRIKVWLHKAYEQFDALAL
jgi:CO dehydrogenase nickel-insertion accessory protein CooC1